MYVQTFSTKNMSGKICCIHTYNRIITEGLEKDKGIRKIAKTGEIILLNLFLMVKKPHSTLFFVIESKDF